MKIIGIDIGLNGGIALTDTEVINMPTITIQKKAPIYVQKRDENGKVVKYKTGKLKGQVKYKIKTPAKYYRELDILSIYSLFSEGDIVVVEQPGTTIGNSAKSSNSTYRRYGEILAAIKIAKAKPVIVSASKWKRDLNLSSKKEQCVLEAEKLSGLSFRTKRNALLDGKAEAWLIRHWYINFKMEKINEKEN